MDTEITVPAAAAAPAAEPAPTSGNAATSPAAAAPASPATPIHAPAPVSSVDPSKYPLREDYAKALLEQKLAVIAMAGEGDNAKRLADSHDAADPAGEGEIAEAPGAPGEATDASAEKPTVDPPVEAADREEIFELEPERSVTPEGLSQWLKENAEFAKLLEADPKLKGQLYKTAREAAELAPYREIFPDLESARSAQAATATFHDVRESFLGSTTREGALAALARIAELSYERGEDGGVLLEDGRPVIGEDFYGFIDNVAALDLEHRSTEVEARLRANLYRSQEARERDESVKAALEILREENAAASPAKEDWPEALRQKQEALDRREDELNRRRRGAQVEERKTFEGGLQQEAQKRIGEGIGRILANVERQGALVSPYLKSILPQAIGAKLVRKIQANPALQTQMRELQRLPIGDQTRQRRLAAIDRVVQQYLPEVAREELREAGVQIANASAAKRAKVDAQIDATRKTEPKGSTGPAGAGGRTLTASAAFDHARAEWQTTNPGRIFDNVAKENILPRVLQLMSSR